MRQRGAARALPAARLDLEEFGDPAPDVVFGSGRDVLDAAALAQAPLLASQPAPQLARNRAMLPEQPVRSAWEARSLEGWTEIGARFGVSQVIVAADWRLRLPELARSDRFALYSVEPAPGPPGSQ